MYHSVTNHEFSLIMSNPSIGTNVILEPKIENKVPKEIQNFGYHKNLETCKVNFRHAENVV